MTSSGNPKLPSQCYVSFFQHSCVDSAASAYLSERVSVSPLTEVFSKMIFWLLLLLGLDDISRSQKL